MDRLFLDANVLFSAALNPHRRIGELWMLADVELLICPYATAEAMRNIAHKYPDKLPNVLELLRRVRQVSDVTQADCPGARRFQQRTIPFSSPQLMRRQIIS